MMIIIIEVKMRNKEQDSTFNSSFQRLQKGCFYVFAIILEV